MTDKQQFSAQLSELGSMLEFILSHLDRAGFDSQERARFEVGAEEALVNVVNYGYPDRDPGVIEISCRDLDGGTIEVVIQDDGIPYDPLANAPKVDPQAPLEKVTYGGYGIYLIQKVMDHCSYRYTDQKNTLILRKTPLNNQG